MDTGPKNSQRDDGTRAGEGQVLRDVLTIEELARRPARPPDYAAECRALASLATALDRSPQSVLQKLVDAALELCGADSAGISLLQHIGQGGDTDVFRWEATAGRFFPLVHNTLPRNASPCGVVLDRNATQLMIDPVHLFPQIAQLPDPIAELLLVPFHQNDRPVGTVWAVAHSAAKRFDAEDARLLASLSLFASAAVRALANLDELQATNLRLRHEIAEREEAETRMARDAMLLGHVRDSVIVTDLKGIVTFWNEGASKLFGFSAPEVIGRPMVDRFPPEARAEVALWIERIAAGEAEFDGEFLDYRRDGTRVWIEAITRRVDGAPGCAQCIMGVSRDISERKRAQTELAEARDDALAANRAKDRHLAFLAHELRGPLTPALLTAASMETDRDLPPPARSDAGVIRRNIEMATRLADDLLDANRVSLGKLELRIQNTDIHATLQTSIAMCEADAAEKQMRLVLDLGARRHQVRGDPQRLAQVWVNLLKNAIKFSPNGSCVTIRSMEAASDRLRVEVVDAGVGLDAELLPRMFNLYEQGERSITRQYAGLGLGLAICKGIVDAHGGAISAASPGKGQGTTLIVELPLSAAEAPVPTSDPSSELTGQLPMSLLRILLVDDHEDTLKAMSRLLTRLSHRVTTASTVRHALEAASAGEFDMLISDIGLPDGTGLDLMRELLKRGPMHGIALTGYGSESDVEQTRAAGFVAHLVKPVNFGQLETLLRAAKT